MTRIQFARQIRFGADAPKTPPADNAEPPAATTPPPAEETPPAAANSIPKRSLWDKVKRDLGKVEAAHLSNAKAGFQGLSKVHDKLKEKHHQGAEALREKLEEVFKQEE